MSRIGIFQELAAVSGAHHERLDGSGYPKGLKAGQIQTNVETGKVKDENET